MISKLSSQVGQQLPEFIRSDYPMFVSFLEAYYEYVAANTIQGNLNTAKDLDETLDIFIESFKRDFAVNIPDMQKLSTKEFLRNAKAFYTSKGTEASFRFLFRAMYGKEIGISYPEQSILRASDGRWNQEVSSIISVVTGDPFSCTGQKVKINSSMTSIVKVVNRVKALPDGLYEIFYDTGGYLKASAGDTVTFEDFAGIIGYAIDHVVINKKGAGFRVGQLFSINGSGGTGAKIRVTRVDSDGGILYMKPVLFGSGYSGAPYFATILPRTTTAVLSDWNMIQNTTEGTTDGGYVFNYAYSDEYAAGYDGDILSSFFTDSSVPPNAGVIDDADTANIEVRFGGLAKYPGFFSTANGFPSDENKLQDNYYYQIYSYVLKLDEQLETYRSMVKSLLHPAGMALFAEYELLTEVDGLSQIDLLDKFLQIRFNDTVNPDDSAKLIDFIKSLQDTVSMDDTKYIYDRKVLADSITMGEEGTMIQYSPGDYGNYPTEYYFDPTEHYTEPVIISTTNF